MKCRRSVIRYARLPRERLEIVQWLGLTLAIVGLGWTFWPVPGMDTEYFPNIRQRAFGRRGPRVLIDEAHWNVYTANGRYQSFALLLTKDGFRVSRGKQPFTLAQLQETDIVVIAGARPPTPLIQLPIAAFSGEEVRVLRQWVDEGGSLLITESPELALAMGIFMTEPYHLIGKGRVAAIADAGSLTAQLIERNGRRIAIGINDPASRNQQKTLDLFHWLARAE